MFQYALGMFQYALGMFHSKVLPDLFTK